MNYVIGIDPGKTTGICIAQWDNSSVLNLDAEGKVEFYVSKAFHLEWDNRHELRVLLHHLNDIMPNYHVVMESFNLYPHAAKGQAHIRSDFPSVQVIGLTQAFLMELYGGLWESHLTMQTPSMRKQVAILPSHRDKLKGLTHAQDAYRHVRYYIVNRVRTEAKIAEAAHKAQQRLPQPRPPKPAS